MPPVDEARETRRGPTRAVPRVLLLLAAALLLARIGTGLWERAHPRRVAELVDWQPAEGALERSRASGLPVLYDFSADWCGPCRLMQREVFADARAASTIGKLFIPVRVVDRQREEGRNPPGVAELQERYRIQAFPTLVVLPADGGRPTVIEGYPGKDALVRRLTEIGVAARLTRRMGPMGFPPPSPR